MRNILCYGDSNTYGFIAGSAKRYDENTRWTKLLQKKLGDSYYVIEEGLNGRTTVFEDPNNRFIKGIDYLELAVATHRPIDLVILMLGTNDTKTAFQAGAAEIAQGLERMIKLLRDPNVYDKEILIVAPIHISDNIVKSEYCDTFGGMQGAEKSRQLAGEYARVAKAYHCHFLDAAAYAIADDTDAIHLDENGHSALAKAFADKVVEIFA